MADAEPDNHDLPDDSPPDTLEDTLWTFRARPDPDSRYDLGVYDGDTYQLLVDQGFRSQHAESLRAWHIDTAEIQHARSEEERQTAYEQRGFVREWFESAIETHDGDWPLIVRTGKAQGKYGRWLGMVFDRNGNSLEADLIDEYGEEYIAQDFTREELRNRFDDLAETL